LNVLYGILFLAVLFGIGHIMTKVKRAANRAASNKSKLLLNPLTFETAAPTQAILRQIEAHVETPPSTSPYNAAVYRSSQTTNQISYTYGNKFEPKMFEAVLLCTPHGTGTKCVLQIPKWRAETGIIIGQEFLMKLRTQVWEAVAAADPSVRVIEASTGR
jgi:hypothetical protein